MGDNAAQLPNNFIGTLMLLTLGGTPFSTPPSWPCCLSRPARQEDEEFKDDLAQPIKSQGVKRIEASIMVFGVKFMVKPGTQFSIRK
ncbi:MAG: hypothetical protein ACOCWR_03490 [Oceanidesulfovibrio sp.]